MSTNSPVRITFHGAAQTVTGSRYLIETDKHRVLIDCGLFQGKKELRLRNWDRPTFDPASLDAIVLTHAHIDHTGYLPLVTKLGFTGPIYCTAATNELAGLLLLDSAHLQEEEARHANKAGSSKHHPAKPLYSIRDAQAALRQLQVIPRAARTEILPGFGVTPVCVGHILGATALRIDACGKLLTFSGDIGRYDAPILPDPKPVDIGDLLICESTYGNRDHPQENTLPRLAAIINRAADRKGAILIPAFALGRTQDLLFQLGELERAGQIPVLPVYVDSPMAIDATSIYRRYHNDFDQDDQRLPGPGQLPLHTANTTFVHTAEESKSLNTLTGSRIIIAGSGMVNGGRILHHMLHFLGDESTTAIFVGYQAEETRGRLMLDGAPSIRIFGANVPVRAKIEELSGMSAHGDRNELIRWVKSCHGTPRFTKITHGEPDASAAFCTLLKERLNIEATAAQHLETIEV
ncbi:MAG: MBL fold metallo-hydrolase [Bdellovibrionota bacterium]